MTFNLYLIAPTSGGVYYDVFNELTYNIFQPISIPFTTETSCNDEGRKTKYQLHSSQHEQHRHLAPC